MPTQEPGAEYTPEGDEEPLNRLDGSAEATGDEQIAEQGRAKELRIRKHKNLPNGFQVLPIRTRR